MSPRILTVVTVYLTIAALILTPDAGLTSDQVFIDTAQVKILGGPAEDHLGASTSGAGDVNGDGFPDIIAGAPGSYNHSSNGGGAAYIILGSGSPTTELDLKFSHPGSVIVIQ